MDSQIVEMLGRNFLVGELIRADLEVALPLRDRGVDLIAYADLIANVPTFRGRPIQMKAARKRSFGLDRKYEKFPNLLIAYVWNLDDTSKTATFAVTYAEAFGIMSEMGYTKTASWERGDYVCTDPGEDLRARIEKYRMSPVLLRFIDNPPPPIDWAHREVSNEPSRLAEAGYR
jgi:hypothetical protein